MDILEPWVSTSDERVLDELRRELATGHVLEGVELSAVARRKDRDEALFVFEDGSGRWALVHLTFSKLREQDARFPKTWIFKDRETVVEYMQASHAAWAGEEKDPDGRLWAKEQQLLAAARTF